jgi:multisubunit Na+/H+ antiporter MnhC subunit
MDPLFLAKEIPAVTEKVDFEKEAVDSGVIIKDDVDVKTVVEADPPSREVGDKVEPLAKSLVVTAVPISTHNNLNPDHAKMDPLLLAKEIPAVTEKVDFEKEALDGGIITKDDMDVKTVVEAEPPSKEVGDKVEPLAKSLVVTAVPLSTHNDLNPDHAKMDQLLLAKEIPAVTEKVDFEKEAVDSVIITKDDVAVKTVVEADPPSREVGDKVELLAKSLVVAAEPLSTHKDLNPDHAKMEPMLLESDIPANTLEAQLETSIVDNGVPAKADVDIKTESKVESPSSNIGDAIEPQTESIVEKALPPRTVLKSKGKKGKRRVKDQMKAVVPVQSQHLLCSATGKDHKNSTHVIDVDFSMKAAAEKDVSATLFTCDANLPAESQVGVTSVCLL